MGRVREEGEADVVTVSAGGVGGGGGGGGGVAFWAESGSEMQNAAGRMQQKRWRSDMGYWGEGVI
jgi:hypothetical protein